MQMTKIKWLKKANKNGNFSSSFGSQWNNVEPTFLNGPIESFPKRYHTLLERLFLWPGALQHQCALSVKKNCAQIKHSVESCWNEIPLSKALIVLVRKSGQLISNKSSQRAPSVLGLKLAPWVRSIQHSSCTGGARPAGPSPNKRPGGDAAADKTRPDGRHHSLRHYQHWSLPPPSISYHLGTARYTDKGTHSICHYQCHSLPSLRKSVKPLSGSGSLPPSSCVLVLRRISVKERRCVTPCHIYTAPLSSATHYKAFCGSTC